MDPLQLREKEIFKTLKEIEGDFVLIGGYAVNSYALPRFSVDCDIVVSKGGTAEIKARLTRLGYSMAQSGEPNVPYGGNFLRYEKGIEKGFKVSVDILVGEILDRQTKARFSSKWVLVNSHMRKLRGKTILENIVLRIIDPDALFIMKSVSARKTDIRDLFMMAPLIGDSDWVKQEVENRCDLSERKSKILRTVDSEQFKDALQGVYGRVDEKAFAKHKSAIKKILD